MPEATLVEAINLALARAMADDQRVILLGEDIGKDGGVFRATDGLLARFGPERVLDTPLAEAAIAGVSIGLAAQGFRPVAEIQFMGFAYATIDQLLNHAARLRTRTRGRLTCPMVMRTPCGAGIHAPEHHSESGEACFTNIPGLRVVIPSSPRRGYGLLLAAISDPDPVVFLEPTRLYRAYRESVEDDGKALPLDQCFTLRDGNDVTLVGWGGVIRGDADRGGTSRRGRHRSRGDRCRHPSAAGCSGHPHVRRKDRTLRHLPRSTADRWLRRRDRRAACRSRTAIAACTGGACDGL